MTWLNHKILNLHPYKYPMDREQLRWIVLGFAALWLLLGLTTSLSWATPFAMVIAILWLIYEVVDAISDYKEGQKNEKHPKRPHKYDRMTYRR